MITVHTVQGLYGMYDEEIPVSEPRSSFTLVYSLWKMGVDKLQKKKKSILLS